MDLDDEVMSGYLLFPPGGIVFNKISKKKNWQQKYCILCNASKRGIQRLEIYDSKDDVNNAALPKIITLENCIKIVHTIPNTIIIMTKALQHHQLAAVSELETAKWVSALQSVAFKELETNVKSFNEDNDLYCSTVDGMFSVKICPTDLSIRFGLEPIRYSLVLTTNAIELRDINDNTKLNATWPYRFIRRYGYHKNKFTFEAGRKCETGEGIFHLEYQSPYEIFRCLSQKMKAMKQMIGNDSLNSPDHSEFNVQTTNSNIPGSRSPLVATRPEDLNLSPMKISSVSSFSSSEMSLPTPPGPKPALKPKPQKPPRKGPIKYNMPRKDRDNADTNSEVKSKKQEPYEVVSVTDDNKATDMKYDKVEIRTDAWMTLGINNVDHNEFSTNLSEKSNCMKFISRSQDNLNCDVNRIILLPSPIVSPEEETYDRLEYFGSTSKLDSPDYKTIEARPSNLFECSKSKDTWNDYDEVANVMQVSRLADDSHLGYGMIRKGSASGATPGPQVPTAAQAAVLTGDDLPPPPPPPPHRNVTDYPIISRSKRV